MLLLEIVKTDCVVTVLFNFLSMYSKSYDDDENCDTCANGTKSGHECECGWELTEKQCKEWAGMCVSCQYIISSL